MRETGMTWSWNCLHPLREHTVGLTLGKNLFVIVARIQLALFCF